MGKRGVVTDYAGEEIRKGDLINYAVRQANRVRVSDAVVEKVTAVREGAHVVPMLKVRPMGVESGFTARKSLRSEWIYAEHVRVIRQGVAA